MSTKAENAILGLLTARVPNLVSETIIRARLSGYTVTELDDALSKVADSDKIEVQVDARKISGGPVRFYRFIVDGDFPVTETIRVGDFEVPRLMADSKAALLPETFNEAVEQLAEHSRTLEDRFVKLVQSEQRRYWGNVAGLFGIFVSVLALILVGLPKIATDPDLSFWQVVFVNLAQVLPIAVVLALFVLAVRFVIR